jgi:hypothetical protein
MSTKRREWALLALALAGAGIGQWVWLGKQWPFIIGLACYGIALFSWSKLTRSFTSRPTSDRTTRLARAGALLFGGLALLMASRGREDMPLTLILASIAIAYLAWAVHISDGWAVIRRGADRCRTASIAHISLHQVVRLARRDLQDHIHAHPIRATLVGGSLLIVTGAGLAAHRGARPSAHLVSLSAWVLGLVLFVGAFVPTNAPARLLKWLENVWADHRLETSFILALWGLATILRATSLDKVPTILTGDEGAMGLQAVKVLRGEQMNPFTTGWTSHPNLYFYNLALFIRFLGQNITALRLASALAGGFTIPITYLLARNCFNRNIAVTGALFLAGYHVHIHYSRLALNNVWAPLAAVLTLLCLWKGLQTRQYWFWALGGIAMGLGQYTYFGARLLPLLVVAWLLYLALINRPAESTNGKDEPSHQHLRLRLDGNGAHLAVFSLGFVLALLPLSWFFLEHWQVFTARIAQVGVFGKSGVNPAQTGYIAPLISGLFKSLLSFNYVHDRSIFYAPPLPLLHWLSGIGLVFGVFRAIVGWRRPGSGLLLIWLLGTVIFGGALMNHPPESPRLLFAAPAVALLVALGFADIGAQISRLTQKTWPQHSQHIAVNGRTLAFAAVLVATLVSTYYYFGVYTPAEQFGDRKTRTAHHLGIWARDLESNHQVYFVGAPYMTYKGFPSISFLAPHAQIQDVMELIDRPLPVKTDSTFVFVPQRLDELPIIASAYPEGRRWTMFDDQGHLLFVAYQVTPET